jgi:hypothetical protein
LLLPFGSTNYILLLLLKADKKAIKALQKNLKEEKSFGDWLEKNNPRIAKRLMKKQLMEREKEKKEATTTATETAAAYP